MSDLSLIQIEQSAWTQLSESCRDPQAAFRYLTLCSVDGKSRPQARTVVLREVDTDARLLEFHTDIRSPKWQELTANPNASVLGYCPVTRIQLRLQGEVELFGHGTELANSAWDALSYWTRTTYMGGPPGDEKALGTPEDVPASNSVSEAEGQKVFGVVRFKAQSLDWFQLKQQDNKRALFDYDPSGALTERCLINP